MTDIRRRIEKRLADLGRSQSWLSVQLGRNRAYVHQYLKSGLPRELDYEDRLKIAELLNMPPHELGVARIEPMPAPSGAREDARPYEPGRGSILARTERMAYLQMVTQALDQAEPAIRPGQILAFDLERTDARRLKTGQVVLVERRDKHDLKRTIGTVVRVFMAPNKLLTNSSAENEIETLDDPSKPYASTIKGVLVSVVSELH